jgi:hypothetical protein
MKYALIALMIPTLATAAIVQDESDAWRATAAVADGALYVDVDPAGPADFVCPEIRFTVVAGDRLEAGDIGFCDELAAPARFRVSGNFDTATVTHIIWNGRPIRVSREAPR